MSKTKSNKLVRKPVILAMYVIEAMRQGHSSGYSLKKVVMKGSGMTVYQSLRSLANKGLVTCVSSKKTKYPERQDYYLTDAAEKWFQEQLKTCTDAEFAFRMQDIDIIAQVLKNLRKIETEDEWELIQIADDIRTLTSLRKRLKSEPKE